MFMFSQVKQIIRKLLTFILYYRFITTNYDKARAHGHEDGDGGLHERERPRQDPVQGR